MLQDGGEFPGVERVEDEVGRRVDGHLGVQALEGDEAAEVERVGLEQLPGERLQLRLLHEQLRTRRGGGCGTRG